MDISSIGQSSNTSGTSASQGQAGFEPQSPLSTPQRNGNSAIAQLSAFGQVKASLADLQSKAQAFKKLSKPPTFADLQVVVQGFVQSFNSLNKNVSQLTSKQGALNADNRPGQALNSVRQAVAGTNQNSLSSLQKMGISQQANGTLSINQKQMEKSFQANRPGALATMHEVANRITQATDKHIPANDPVSKKVNELSAHINDLGNTRSKAQGYLNTQKNTQQFMAAQLPSAGGHAARNAVAAYSSVASL